jgi:hypothetical protein
MTTQDIAAQLGSSIDSRLGCSTISFRAWSLPGALADISGQGFDEIDLGALPRVCDHVPTPLPPELVDVLADQILASGLAVSLINADVAAMNDPGRDAAEIQRRLRTLVDLAGAVGTSGHRTVQRHRDGGSHPHRGRRSSSAASATTSRMSTSPTQCRATSSCPSATGRSTSPAVSRRWPTPGYAGHFTLELETRDITNDHRPEATARAAQLISGLI